MKLREYRASDCPELTRLFYDTVHSVCAGEYTPEQLDAWADAVSYTHLTGGGEGKKFV